MDFEQIESDIRFNVATFNIFSGHNPIDKKSSSLEEIVHFLNEKQPLDVIGKRSMSNNIIWNPILYNNPL